MYNKVLNSRIVKLEEAEEHDMYADKQNGFRKDRSRKYDLFTLSSIIRNSPEFWYSVHVLKGNINMINSK